MKYFVPKGSAVSIQFFETVGTAYDIRSHTDVDIMFDEKDVIETYKQWVGFNPENNYQYPFYQVFIDRAYVTKLP